MNWEIVCIGFLVVLITGVAIWAMRRSRKIEALHQSTVSGDLVERIVSALGKELREIANELKEELRNLPKYSSYTQGQAQTSGIQIDESIIPIDLKTSVQTISLDGATKEEKVVDDSLNASKSKLAGIMKKRNKEQ